MHARDRIIETLKLLDEGSVLKLYDLALTFRKSIQPVNVKRHDLANIRRSQQILSSIKGSLSDHIQKEREVKIFHKEAGSEV